MLLKKRKPRNWITLIEVDEDAPEARLVALAKYVSAGPLQCNGGFSDEAIVIAQDALKFYLEKKRRKAKP